MRKKKEGTAELRLKRSTAAAPSSWRTPREDAGKAGSEAGDRRRSAATAAPAFVGATAAARSRGPAAANGSGRC